MGGGADEARVVSLRLYRWVLQEFRRLPDSCRDYYTKMARSQINGHVSETNPERIANLQLRAQEDVAWIVHKYLGADAPVTPFEPFGAGSPDALDSPDSPEE